MEKNLTEKPNKEENSQKNEVAKVKEKINNQKENNKDDNSKEGRKKDNINNNKITDKSVDNNISLNKSEKEKIKNSNNDKDKKKMKKNMSARNVTNRKEIDNEPNISLKQKKAQEKMNKLKEAGKSLLLGGPKVQCTICNKFIESHLHKIHVNAHPTQIFKWMYLGTFDTACDITELRRLGINYILNVASDCKNTVLPENIKELHLKVKDEETFDIFDYFEKGNAFINKVRSKGGVILIHCKFGISRSPTFVIAYLIKYFRFTVQTALIFLRKRRPQVKPNDGFIEFLNKYEKSFKKNRPKISI